MKAFVMQNIQDIRNFVAPSVDDIINDYKAKHDDALPENVADFNDDGVIYEECERAVIYYSDSQDIVRILQDTPYSDIEEGLIDFEYNPKSSPIQNMLDLQTKIAYWMIYNLINDLLKQKLEV